ncbi:hypothetical protein [Kutzneria buriramensis]|uniref:Secreted protein n=1 Tax=Kutzneria buriramensis TaxID=1045776 RepID=A0A3E0GSV2_9PSEU|nr:hypothetical protein [Kutzneria buriramensis]REH26213.1 hypothetical protein BCF44_13468 [Kutzneria buriramensis]
MRMSYAAVPRKFRVAAVAVGAVVAVGGVVVAATSHGGTANAAAAVPTVVCPSVQDKLPAIPAASQAEVTRNLNLLNTQIAEADKRLVTTQGQGGPNFINNAILGPLKDKRVSTIDRIAISIGRHAAKPTGLDSLAPCTLSTGGSGGASAGSGAGAGAGAGSGAGASGGTGSTAGSGATGSAGAGAAGGGTPTVNCPSVQDKLPAVPAAAQAGVTAELANLNKEITEANNRLVTSKGQGGPNFINNAILGPLKDKRIAVLDRIAIDIGRVSGAKPAGLDALAPCTLNQ